MVSNPGIWVAPYGASSGGDYEAIHTSEPLLFLPSGGSDTHQYSSSREFFRGRGRTSSASLECGRSGHACPRQRSILSLWAPRFRCHLSDSPGSAKTGPVFEAHLHRPQRPPVSFLRSSRHEQNIRSLG